MILDGFGYKIKVQNINDSVYVMKGNPKDYMIKLNNDNGELTAAGRVFIRPNKTLEYKIRGSWVNNAIPERTIYEFRETENSDVCYIWINGEIGSKYYPKKTDKGFEFTMGYELVTFNFDENDNLYDSEGNMYAKIVSK